MMILAAEAPAVGSLGPAKWRTVPLKHVVDPSRRITYGIVQCGEDVVGGVPYIRPIDMADEGGASLASLRRTSPEIAAAYRRSVVTTGDLVVSIGPSYGKVMEVPDELNGANLTQGTARVAVGNGTDARYLFWVLRSSPSMQFWDAACSGATFRALTLEALSQTPVCLPDLKSQRSIAGLLDRETEKIDVLVAKKKRLIELLKEKRFALISHAVTKGLDVGVPTKDSGWSLVGDVPRHWDTPRLGLCCSLLTDGTHAPPPWSPGQHRLLSARNIVDGEFVLRDDDRTMSPEDARLMPASCIARQGDVLLVIVGGTTGKSAVAKNVHNVAVQRSLAILRPRLSVMEPEYLRLWLSSRPVQQSIGRVVDQYAAQPGIYLQDVGALPAVVPPLVEQSRILTWVDDSLSGERRLGSAISRQMTMLHEYRSALITAAVTGQIDVREYAKQAN